MPASRFRRVGLGVLGLAFLALCLAPAADASFTVYIVGCTRQDRTSCFEPAGPGLVYGSAVPPLYTGTTITLRIYADSGINPGCPPTHVNWGDGATTNATTSPGDHRHKYTTAGTYTIRESDSCGHSGTTSAEISPGGGGFGLDLDLGFLEPVVTGLVTLASAAGVALSLAPVRFPPGFSATREPKQAAHKVGELRPRLTLPASHSQNMMSLADIPQGAKRFPDQWVESSPGKPADPFTQLECPACHSPVGYTSAGWYCRNPACPLINHKDPASYFTQPGGHFGVPSVAPKGP